LAPKVTKKHKVFVFVIFVSFVASLGVLCGRAITLISVADEIAIGREANADTRKKIPELQDQDVRAYVRGLGARLAKAASGPRYPYSFSVANYREINAFALPGGPVWVNRGVLQAASNESQVAGVLAHEIAHVAQRHPAQQMSNAIVANLGLGALGALLGNVGGAGAARAAAGLGTNLWFLKFSRDDESEADRVGLQILRRGGWDGRGMVELFEILKREHGRNPGAVEVFLSSHPAPAERIRALQADVARAHGGVHNTGKFQAIRRKLLKMTPARSMPKR
jgi:predicted Zn-dependent protease